MQIDKRTGDTVELELEIRDLKTRELVDLSLYDLHGQLSDGIGGVVAISVPIVALTGNENKGRCRLTVSATITATLFPLMYEINTNYVEKASGYSESMQTVFLQMRGL